MLPTLRLHKPEQIQYHGQSYYEMPDKLPGNIVFANTTGQDDSKDWQKRNPQLYYAVTKLAHDLHILTGY